MDRRYPTVQLVAGERGLELRLVAHLMGDDHDMTGDEAGTWLMSLWERVRSAAGLLSEYGIVAPIAVPSPAASLSQGPPIDTPPGGEDQREGQTPALDGHARIGSPTERAQKGQADRAKILQAMRTRPGRWTAHQVLLATGLSASAVSWQLRHLKRSGLLRLEQTPGLGRSGCVWVLTESAGDAGEAESEDQPDRAVNIGAAHRAKGEGVQPEAPEHEVEEEVSGESGAGGSEAVTKDRLPLPGPRVVNVAQSIDVRQIQEHSAGKVFLMLGGTPRRETAEAIRVALKLKELRWPELRDSRDLPLAMKEINRGDVAMVLVNRFNRRCSRLYGHEARLIGKPIVIIPKGYGLVQVVHSIIDQWPPQWCRNGFRDSGEIGVNDCRLKATASR